MWSKLVELRPLYVMFLYAVVDKTTFLSAAVDMKFCEVLLEQLLYVMLLFESCLILSCVFDEVVSRGF